MSDPRAIVGAMVDHADTRSIDQVLEDFLREVSIARHPATGRRVAAARARFEQYLAADVEATLSADERALVAAERQFSMVGAVGRVLGPAALLRALPRFLDQAWLPSDERDARTQVRMVELLVEWVVAHESVAIEDAAIGTHGVARAAAVARHRLAVPAPEPGGASA